MLKKGNPALFQPLRVPRDQAVCQQPARVRTRVLAVVVALAAAAIGLATARAIETITVLALFEDKALLHVDGRQRMFSVGETGPEGITLVSADSDRAVVKINGEEEVLELGMVATFPGGANDVSPTWDGPEKLTLWAEDDGFFYASGHINGTSVRFLVDTGANTIALNRNHAERIGIDYRNGRRGVATTASGVTPMYLVTLDRVSIGEITLRDIDAGVLLGNHPNIPLLGMSFLGQLDMVRTGQRLELKRR